MEAGLVLPGLGALTTQLHPVLYQVQRLYKDSGAHPGQDRSTKGTDRSRSLRLVVILILIL